VKVVISGGTKGIGKAIAEKYLSKGDDIAICARNKADLEACSAEWSAQYPDRTVVVSVCDMSKKNEVKAWADEILSTWSTIDILVNNAGVFIPGEVLKEEEGALEKMIETNLYRP